MRIPRPRAAAYVKFRSRSSEDRPCVGGRPPRAGGRRGARRDRRRERPALLLARDRGPSSSSDLRGSADYRRRMVAYTPGGRWRCSMDDRVTARIGYSQDVERPGMLHGRILRSHYPHARVRGGAASWTSCRRAASSCSPRTSPARGSTGASCRTRRSSRAASRASWAIPWRPSPRRPREPRRRRSLPGGRPGAAARRHVTRRRARAGRAAPARRRGVARAAGAWTGLRPGGGNVLHTFRLVHGRGEAGFDEAEVTVEGEWECAGAAHAPLEPHASLAEWRTGA